MVENAYNLMNSSLQYYRVPFLFFWITFNALIFILNIESVVPFAIMAILIGYYKGRRCENNIKSIFNLSNEKIDLKNKNTAFELMGALLFSLSTDISYLLGFIERSTVTENLLYIVITLIINVAFGLFLFRFLFLNLLKESE